MDLDAARSFLADHHRAVLLTLRGDGSPQLSPVVCALGSDGHLVVSTRETAAKTRNVLRSPEVSFCVLPDGFFGEWIQVSGRAEVIRLPRAMEGLIECYRSIAGEHPDWEEYRRAMVSERRVLLSVTLERAGPDLRG